MFASCWGFQALARALGGEVVHRSELAELGTVPAFLTDAGTDDPVFSIAGDRFLVHSGHEDTVLSLPPVARRLASSQRVENQAFKLVDLPVYATQFHPELRLAQYIERVDAYPWYVTRITGLSLERFRAGCSETPQANLLLRTFVQRFVDQRRA